MTDIYEKTIEDLGGLMIKFFGCNRITMPIQQAIVLLEAHKQIVLCKDCKHGEPCKNGLGEDAIECFDSDICLEVRCRRPDWFCANGELKE